MRTFVRGIVVMDDLRFVYSLLLVAMSIMSAHNEKSYENTDVWNNPGISQAPLSGFSPATTYSSTPHRDERISDLIANNVLRFANEIGQQLNEGTYSKSQVFSPVSVVSALALLMLGAKGKSHEQLKQLLGLTDDAELSAQPNKFHEQFGYLLEDLQQKGSNVSRSRKTAYWRSTTAKFNIRHNTATAKKKSAEHIIKVANGLFTQFDYNVNPTYGNAVKSVYQTDLNLLDFQRKPSEARDYINAWVNTNTFGKIPAIITEDIERSTTVIIANALFFKGFWENTFFESGTVLDDFYPDGLQNPPIRVTMMVTGDVFPFYEAVEHNCRIIGLPYKDNATTMYVIQPHQSSREKLREFIKYLDAYKIEEMIDNMKRKSVILAFPKMKFMRKLKMKPLLNRLGINDIFDNGLSDLSLISAPVQQEIAVESNVASYPIQSFDLNTRWTNLTDRYNERPLLFSRFGSINANKYLNETALETTTIPSENKDRTKRETNDFLSNHSVSPSDTLKILEGQRNANGSVKSNLFVQEIVHKVDFDVNEHGTEAAAATVALLYKTGPEVLFRAESPFLILIRHDPTKLILFYAIINEPEL